MSNSPTLPPTEGPQRKPTPLPALATESDARVQAALAASARAEASLTGLFRAIQHLGNGVGGAREANESLTLELEGLRELLGGASEQEQLFQRKLSELESVLDRTRKEHASERAFLIEQQDAFLVKLLDEQEHELERRDSELETLRTRLSELEQRNQMALAPTLTQMPSSRPPPVQIVEPKPAAEGSGAGLERAEREELERTAQKLAEDRERARETVARLQAQRDDAQSAVARIGKERDDALYEIHRLKSVLGGPRIPLTTLPPPPESRRDSSSGRAYSAEQAEFEARLGRPTAPESAPSASTPIASPASTPISSVLSPPPSNPNASPIPSRLSPPPSRLTPPPPTRNSPPPEELRRALTTQSSASNRPVIKQKPDVSTRPLVGYSNADVEPERLENAAQLTSRPPPGSAKP